MTSLNVQMKTKSRHCVHLGQPKKNLDNLGKKGNILLCRKTPQYYRTNYRTAGGSLPRLGPTGQLSAEPVSGVTFSDDDMLPFHLKHLNIFFSGVR